MTATYHITAAPPPTNNLFRNVIGKGRVKTQRYMEWLQAAGWDVKLARANFRPDGEYAVDITIPTAWRKARNGHLRDLDGFLKPTLDLLVSMGATPDDRHCARLTARYGLGEAMEVRVADA